MRFFPAALPLIALAAPAAAQSSYRATGAEPFWHLTIDGSTMRLEEAGRRPLVVPRPPARPGVGGERYVTRGLSVDVTRAHCSDGMSDRVYRDMVMVEVGQRMLRGCGNPVVGRPYKAAAATPPRPSVVPGVVPSERTAPRSALADTRWTIWQVNGRALPANPPLVVSFSGNRIEGKLCNRFRGGYALAGERLQVNNFASTRMACQGPAMTTESIVFALLRGPVSASVSRWGTLVLAGGKTKLTLRPVR